MHFHGYKKLNFVLPSDGKKSYKKKEPSPLLVMAGAWNRGGDPAMGEAIRHHYIPRFLLRPFCYDEERVWYYRKKTAELVSVNIRDIFMERNMYRDEINHPEQPTKIETDFAAFEREAAEIIREYFLNRDEIDLPAEKDDALKLFFGLMSFRSKNGQRSFSDAADEKSKALFSLYQEDGNLNDLWKRNLGYLVNCRSLKDVLKHPEIDDVIKDFMARNIYYLFGTHFAVVERRGKTDFILSDSYPVMFSGKGDDGLILNNYAVFPISPARAILQICDGAENASMKTLGIKKKIIKPVQQLPGKNKIRITKIYDAETAYLNSHFFKLAEEGCVISSRAKERWPAGLPIEIHE